MSIIKTEALSFDYVRRDNEGNVDGIYRALDDLNIEVNKGEFIAIIGHNGSGKSTLSKHLNAILTPTEGTVYVDGMNTKDRKDVWNIRKTAGMVFQNPDNQIIASVVEEDVGFGPENLSVETKEIWERVEQSLRAVGMYEYRKKSPNRLSGGQKQRVAIAGILAMKPECIVLDEPTAMLDPKGRREVIDTIRELNKKEHITIILVTHYMDEVVDADRIFVMNRGKLEMQGSPKKIFANVDRLREYGLDVPQVTELAYRLKMKGFLYSDAILTVDEFVKETRRLVTESRTE